MEPVITLMKATVFDLNLCISIESFDACVPKFDNIFVG